MVQAWKVLLDHYRHFQLSRQVTELVFQGPLPAAAKRMRDEELARAAQLVCALAEQSRAFDPDAAASGPSPRDIMLPAFAVLAAEAAYRCLRGRGCWGSHARQRRWLGRAEHLVKDEG